MVYTLKIKSKSMKVMKSIALLGLISFAWTMSFAQQHGHKGTPEQRAEKMTEKMSAELALDESKSAELKAINLRFATAADEIHNNAEITEEQKKEQMNAVKEQHNKDLSTVLTAKQMERLKEMKEDHKSMKEDARGMTPEQRAAKMTGKMNEVLGLSEDQFQKVGALNLGVEQKIEAIRNDANIGEEQKKEFIKGNRKSQQDALGNILTPEQIEKWNAHKAEHHEHHEE